MGLIGKLGDLRGRLSGPGSIALSSVSLQAALFILLIALKRGLSSEEFVHFIGQFAWASIFGSIAGLKMELLLYQRFGAVTREVVFVPLLLTFGLSLLPVVADHFWSATSGYDRNLSYAAAVVSISLSLVEIQNFICVQQRDWHRLLLSRTVQASGIVFFALLLHFSLVAPSGHAALYVYGLVLLLPALVWIASALRAASDTSSESLREVFTPVLMTRAVSLSLSTLVNSVFVNVAVLIASVTQPPAFTADFGFVLKLLTGPVTLIRQVFGQMFLARALAIGTSTRDALAQVRALMMLTMQRSLLAFLACAVIVIPLLFGFRSLFSIEHPEMILWLTFAVGAQSVVNPVAMVRTIIHDETAFLFFDVMRCVVLVVILWFPLMIGYDLKFSLASGLLYLLYIAFMHWRLDRHAVGRG